MAALLRLLPRHWDGKRLLQFLTGLALLALTLGGPVASAAPTSSTSASTPTTTATTATVASAADAAASTDPAAVAVAVQRQTECQHDASGVTPAVPAAPVAAPAGVAPGAHDSRAPPRP